MSEACGVGSELGVCGLVEGVDVGLLEARIIGGAADMAAAMGRSLEAVAAYDVSEGWRAWGCGSCAHWLNWKTGMSLRTAREKVRVGLALEALPAIKAALWAGEISFSKARAVTRVATARNETELLGLALASTASMLERICDGYREATLRPVEENQDAAAVFASREVTSRWNHDGSATLRCVLPDDMAEQVAGCVDVAVDRIIADAAAPGQNRREVIAHLGGLAAVRADALHGLVTGTLDMAVAPDPDVHVVVDLDTVACDPTEPSGGSAEPSPAGTETTDTGEAADVSGGSAEPSAEPAGGVCEVGGRRVAPEVARRWACHPTLRAMLIDLDGRPVTESSKARVVSPKLRRLLERRDRHCCQFPGCGSTRRLHAHHVIHWADGGPTELDNLILLCHFHHHVVHEGGWSITGTGAGGFTFHRPDATPVGIDRLSGDPFAIGTASAEPDRLGQRPISSYWDGRHPDYSWITTALIHNHGPAEPAPHQAVA